MRRNKIPQNGATDFEFYVIIFLHCVTEKVFIGASKKKYGADSHHVEMMSNLNEQRAHWKLECY
jgi:hypothetical protein